MPYTVSCTCPRAIKFDGLSKADMTIERPPHLIIAKDLVPFRRLKKGGELLKCPHCGRMFLIEESQGTRQDVLSDDLKRIEQWENGSYHPTPEQRRVLAEIGATPPHVYGSGREVICFPCEGRLKGDSQIRKLFLSFGKIPPLELWHEKKAYHLITDIEEIRPSDFVLPREIRYATSQTDEISNGFAPTIIVAPNGREYLLNGVNDFFWRDGFKGSEMRLGDNGKRTLHEKSHGIPYTKNSLMLIDIVVGDWSDDLERLRIKA